MIICSVGLGTTHCCHLLPPASESSCTKECSEFPDFTGRPGNYWLIVFKLLHLTRNKNFCCSFCFCIKRVLRCRNHLNTKCCISWFFQSVFKIWYKYVFICHFYFILDINPNNSKYFCKCMYFIVQNMPILGDWNAWFKAI